MLEYNLPRYLPSAEELPDSDETAMDNGTAIIDTRLVKVDPADTLVRTHGLVVCDRYGYLLSP